MVKTPNEKWKSTIVEYRKNCQKIISISKSIRYVGVINEFGRTLTGMMQTGFKPLLKPEEAKNEFFVISNLITLRSSQTKSFGPLDHVVLTHKTAKIVCIPSKQVMYYVSVNSNTKSLDEIIKKTKSLI
ncbi:MAG TPA: hypothetical protein VFM64_04410 [Candidatus Nitrosotenuis sp.]|nr:hypothetical protein [Candidatus Nitrosotenuis sp.]